MAARQWIIGFLTVTLALTAVQTAASWWRPEIGTADPNLPYLPIHQAEQAPVIDGRLDDDLWKQAPRSSVFNDEYGYPVSGEITFQIAQVGDVLYVGLRVRYAPDRRPAQKPHNPATRDGDFWAGESVELFMDVDRDASPGYYQFAISPQGVTGDFYHPQKRDPEPRWNPQYEVATHWTSEEWTIEWGIPIAAFDRSDVVFENFGMNVGYVGTAGVATWSPLKSDGWHYPHRFGEVRGLQGEGVTPNEPGRFHKPFVGVSDEVIRAEAHPSLMTVQTPEMDGEPRISVGRRGMEIEFVVNTETDVAVWIEDADRLTVRHLAAGMLGDNAPPPLQSGVLQQRLQWDYKDDFGERVPDGAYHVRIGVGSQATLDRVLRHNTTPRDIVGFAVDADGSLVTVGGQAGFESALEVQRHGRDGDFLSMIHPPRADIPVERLRGLNVIDYGPDGRVMFGSHRSSAFLPSLDTPMPHNPLINSDGQIILFGGEFGGGPARFYKLNADGSIPEDFIGPYVMDIHWQHYFTQWATRFHFALDPTDEDYVYLSGLKTIHRTESWSPGNYSRRTTLYNAVYRVRWGVESALEPFLGTPNVAGREGSDAPGRFNDPQGIAFDPDGNLWVCDRGNDRIQVFDADGDFLHAFDVPRPYLIEIHPETGDFYVLASEEDNPVLIKFAAGAQPRELYRTEAMGPKDSYWRAFRLDASGDAPVLWLTDGDVQPSRIYRVTDAGDGFSVPTLTVGRQRPDRSWGYDRIAAGWDSDIVWANGRWIDGNTGEVIGRGGSEELSAVRDGTWAVRTGFWSDTVTFYPEDWPTNPDAARIRSWRVVPPTLNRGGRIGSTVAPNGDVYVARFYQWQAQASGRHQYHETNSTHIAVDHYNKYGEMLGHRIINELGIGAASPAVDLHGNIFVVDNIGRKIGQLYEDDIAPHLPSWMIDYELEEEWDRLRRGEKVEAGYEKFVHDPLIRTVGVVYKFGPEGGGLLYRAGQGPDHIDWPRHIEAEQATRIRNTDWGYPAGPTPERPATHWSSAWVNLNRFGMYPRWQEGVRWEFPGASLATGRYNLGHTSCICPSLRIAVDDFSRVYIPAAHRSTVRVVDGAGNEILRIGSYANLDSSGPGSLLPEPEIPLLQPQAVALSRRYVYIGEQRLQRLLRVRLGYVCEYEHAINVPAE